MSTISPPPKAAISREELLPALEFAQYLFARWRTHGLLSGFAADEIDRHYRQRLEQVAQGSCPESWTLPAANQCWSCSNLLSSSQSYCRECGAPVCSEDVTRLRHLRFVGFEIGKHLEANRLSLASAHACQADCEAQIRALTNRLDQQRAVEALPVDAPPATSPPSNKKADKKADRPAPPRRSVMEILLDPRSSQWLLALGGVLLILGLVIYLATLGIFENNYVIATLLGSGNLLILAVGWYLVLATRYQLTGRALSLLACLALPLNLWFYSAQQLITVEQGGLWLPAVVICVLYAASAWVLRDSHLVYVLVGGVVLTALLILANRDLERFWQITVPAFILVGVGLACIHVERFFAPDEGDFSRANFGLAFFWSGHVTLLAGLLLVLGAQLIGGPFYEPYFKNYYESVWQVSRPDVARFDTQGPWMAVLLTLLGTYAYVYSDLVVRRVGWYLVAAIFTMAWTLTLLIQLLIPHLAGIELAIITISLTGLAMNTALSRLQDKKVTVAKPLCGLVSIVPVALGIWVYLSKVVLQPEPLAWFYVGAMVVAAVCCRICAVLYQGEEEETVYLFGTGASLLVGLVGLLKVINPDILWHQRAPIVALLPILYLIAARLYRGRGPELPLRWVAHTGAVVLLLSSLATALPGFVLLRGDAINLYLALFFFLMTVFYALETLLRPEGLRRGEGVAVAALALMLAGTLWQLLNYANFSMDLYIVALGVFGLALLIAYWVGILDKWPTPGLPSAAFWAGNALILLASTAGALKIAEELVGPQQGDLKIARLPLSLAVISLIAIALVQHSGFRRAQVLSALVQIGLTVLTLAVLSGLTYWQKLELVLVTLGVALLVTAHVGLLREQQQHHDIVTFALLLGCLLAAIPLCNATLYCRFNYSWLKESQGAFHTFNEIGMLVVGLLLLASGVVLRIRLTTLTGLVTTGLWLVTLVMFVHLPEVLQSTAIYLMLGGGAFFLTGLVLSIYRDRLVTLPERFQRREGIFRILTWR